MPIGAFLDTTDVLSTWLELLGQRQATFAALLRSNADERCSLGYGHTLEEICQQPRTWRATAREVAGSRSWFARLLSGCRAVTFTGSGSSEYAGGCIHLALRDSLQIPADTVPAGLILTQRRLAIPPLRPALLVSLARSGDSPESCAAVQYYLNTEPDVRHLVVTCNPAGRLVREYQQNPRVDVFVLDSRTNDRGLAMTSSFTNMVLVGHFLGLIEFPQKYIDIVDGLSSIAEEILANYADRLTAFVRTSFSKALFLGSGSAYSAAREGALKMLELTAGRIATMPETPLGLRHGPMSWVDSDTVVVLFLSSDPVVRAYECDLLHELETSGIGIQRIIVGDSIPSSICTAATLPVECPGLGAIGDRHSQIIYVLVAQLLAFLRSLEENLKPDTPSESGVISRVVREFRIHTLMPDASL